MTEIPDSLRTLFSGTIDQQNGKYVVTVPTDLVENGTVTTGDTYRVALLESTSDERDAAATEESPPRSTPTAAGTDPQQSEPPVEEGEIRDLTIDTRGDEGDGLATVERGFVVIVPDAEPGDEVRVEIQHVTDTVAFAEVIDPDPALELPA